eukprot:3411022-Pleurochrysis_carterae.AAC.1
MDPSGHLYMYPSGRSAFSFSLALSQLDLAFNAFSGAVPPLSALGGMQRFSLMCNQVHARLRPGPACFRLCRV